MAPLSSGLDELLRPRTLGGNSTNAAPAVSFSEGNSLQALALAFATISVASSILAFYWFVRMRRSFRHDLIMLLIQSDMFKALWLMVYPIVVFANGPVESNSTFCQAQGFFLAWGIEASDISVLMIAIHSALYIFRPRASAGEGGLYPYRHVAYAVWLILPLLMASLAFVNDRGAYAMIGTYCYLPERPFWYRLALSWIPRYIIFVVILAIYVSIYYYVRYKFHGFRRKGSSASLPQTMTVRKRKAIKQRTVPPMPAFACHGLIPMEPFGQNQKSDEAALPMRPAESYGPRTPSHVGVHRFILESLVAGNNDVPTPPSEPPEEVDSLVGPSTPQALSQHRMAQTPASNLSMLSEIPSASRAASWRDGFVKRLSPLDSRIGSHKPSTTDIFSILRHHPDNSGMPTPTSQLQLVNSRGQSYHDAEMMRTREKIQRQLRFLFIYPLVYILMWILPFISHVLQYDDRYALDPPFGLTCATTIFLCLQGAVDCWLFSTREKPWKQIPGTNGSFWQSLKFWIPWTRRGKHTGPSRPGKSRDETARESRAAYLRRDEEMAQWKSQADTETPRRGQRTWWEASGLDGTAAMSPLVEEENPLELHSRMDGETLNGPESTPSEAHAAENPKMKIEKSSDA